MLYNSSNYFQYSWCSNENSLIWVQLIIIRMTLRFIRLVCFISMLRRIDITCLKHSWINSYFNFTTINLKYNSKYNLLIHRIYHHIIIAHIIIISYYHHIIILLYFHIILLLYHIIILLYHHSLSSLKINDEYNLWSKIVPTNLNI